MIIWIIFLVIADLRLLWFIINYYAIDRAFAKTSVDAVQNVGIDTPGISVIVANKNNGQGLARLISVILGQDYPNFELIIVDDYSEDGSAEMVEQNTDSKLKLIKCSKDLPGKKQALTEGIEAAQYDLLLFTDADCVPASDQWMRKMMLSQNADKAIVLGIAPMFATPGFGAMISRTDTLDVLRQYVTAAILNRPYMGVGRNLMYHKKLWEGVKGFESHSHAPAGDDDLQVQAMKESSEVNICADQEAFVYSEPKKTLTEFIRQKTRHVSVAAYYNKTDVVLAGFDGMLRMVFYTVFIIGLFFSPMLVTMILLGFYATAGLVLHFIYRRIRQKSLALFFPFADFILAMLYQLIFARSLFKKFHTWT